MPQSHKNKHNEKYLKAMHKNKLNKYTVILNGSGNIVKLSLFPQMNLQIHCKHNQNGKSIIAGT